MDVLLRRLVRAAVRRGVAGEHWAWFAVAATAFVLRRAMRPDRHSGLSVPVEEGERYEVALTPKPTRGRPRARRF